jgi:hypothetical protein
MNAILIWSIVIGVILALSISIYFLRKSLELRKERFSKLNAIPTQVLEQFNNLERRYEEELNQVKNGKRKNSPDPYNIIWEDAKRNRAGETISSNTGAASAVAEPSRSNASSDGNSDTNRLPSGGQGVQVQPPINLGEDNQSIGEPKRDSNDNAGRRAALIARLRARRSSK